MNRYLLTGELAVPVRHVPKHAGKAKRLDRWAARMFAAGASVLMLSIGLNVLQLAPGVIR